MSIAVVGVNHRTAPLEVRERFAHAPREVPAALERVLSAGAGGGVLLSTCNRTEVYARTTLFHPGVDDLRHFLADLEERYGDNLLRWSGMIADLPGIDAMAESFARRGRYRRGDWKRAAAREAEQPPFEDRGRRESGIDFVIVPEEPLRRA